MQRISLAGHGAKVGARPALCIGNFDGAHRGHARLVEVARGLEAGRDGVIALSFDPHPRVFFQPEAPFFRLTPPARREERLAAIGFDQLALLRFDRSLAGLGAAEFVERVLVDACKAGAVVVGQDFHFGHKRQGTPEFLVEYGRRFGFEVALVEPLRDPDGTVISSSAIRSALAVGDLSRANRMLGYPFEVAGTVIHGAKRGRELGYPTANIELDPGCGLRHGIYAVRIKIDGEPKAGVASFGRRPMFDNGAPLLEVYVIDFAGDLYGKPVRVSFEAFLRGEERFDSLESLIRQMDRDQAEARRILSEQ